VGGPDVYRRGRSRGEQTFVQTLAACYFFSDLRFVVRFRPRRPQLSKQIPDIVYPDVI